MTPFGLETDTRKFETMGIKQHKSDPSKYQGHLFKKGAETHEKHLFEREYGKKKGDYIYSTVLGKIKREKEGY
jgi:hypothetical protein